MTNDFRNWGDLGFEICLVNIQIELRPNGDDVNLSNTADTNCQMNVHIPLDLFHLMNNEHKKKIERKMILKYPFPQIKTRDENQVIFMQITFKRTFEIYVISTQLSWIIQKTTKLGLFENFLYIWFGAYLVFGSFLKTFLFIIIKKWLSNILSFSTN